jgi:uncharacterized membrane protein
MRALKQLHADGNLTLYALAFLAKNASGKIASRQAAYDVPLGLAVGTLTGGLLGLMGVLWVQRWAWEPAPCSGASGTRSISDSDPIFSKLF